MNGTVRRSCLETCLCKHLHAQQTWQPLSGTSTLLQVVDASKNHTAYAPQGSSIQSRDQFIITEDSIEVVDLLLVRFSCDVFPRTVLTAPQR